MSMAKETLDSISSMVETMLQRARIPGAGLAVVASGEVILAQGFGYRDLEAQLPLTADTAFPIASTTKAMNATLLGMLAEDDLIDWDAPVRDYLPRFELHDPRISPLVTVRDLVIMRTGLAAHDFIWMENPIIRAELVQRLRYLPQALGFRERFQYNNLTPTVAGHVAEVVTGRRWEELLQERIFEPLGMSNTAFAPPAMVPATVPYHENTQRKLCITPCFAAEPIGPAGGSIYSTVADMARWVALNLDRGRFAGCELLSPATLSEIHAPQVLMGSDPAAPSPDAAYALGWFVDEYNGHRRISHTGHLHDVHSSVMLFPDDGIGMVSFINCASSRTATLICEHTFDRLLRLSSPQSLEDALAQYENKIASNCKRLAEQRRVLNTVPSHAIDEYTGLYTHPGYGALQITRVDESLTFTRNQLVLPLEHWHYDAWTFRENDLFEIHKPHPFDRGQRIVFKTNGAGEIRALTMSLEPAMPAACFTKMTRPSSR